MDFFKKIFKSVEDSVDKLARDSEVQKWLDELDEAQGREKNWRTEAQRIVDIYEQQRNATADSSDSAFNILYANTETLSPAVYNNTPRPVVKRKTDRENPVAVAAAQVLKNILIYLNDTVDPTYTPFDELQKIAVQEALVPGRGLCRFSYDADIAGVGEQKVVKYETVCGDPVPWNRIVYGYAKQWSNIPWQAYEHYFTREECIATFGEEIGKKLKLTHAPKEDQDKEQKGPQDAEGVKFCHLWEIWDKRTKKVIWVSEGWPKIVKETEDPLKLEGFFNSPRPIAFLTKISSLVPQALFVMYEKQAGELEDISRRIIHLTRAMKIRGFYDGTLEGLDTLLSSPENTLMKATNVAALQQGQTLEKSIWLMPIAELIQVLQQLYLNRQQIISVIHQITGVADIMRGSSAASETLGAQKMKEAWGTMRLKRMQKEVQRFSRDCYRMQAELAAKHFSIQTLQTMTGLKFPTQVEQQQAQTQLQALMMQKQQMEATGQPIPPELMEQGQQQAAELQKTLDTPSWEAIASFLKDDSIRNYRIDIETNSTVDIEATEDKAELAEMMNSMAQLLNGVFPMVKEGVLPFQAAKALVLTVVSKFRLGEDVEETFRNLKEPPKQADPAQQKVEAEMKRDEQAHAMDMEGKKAELDMKQREMDMELAFKEKELAFKERELELQARANQLKHEQAMEMQVLKATMPPAAPQPSQGGENAGS